jgi:enoyl-CoA hydratase/carnithine racemase
MSAVHLNINGPVAELVLDNPGKLNALTLPMLAELETHCAQIENNDKLRVVLLRAEGDRAFCVGADINAWADLSPFNFARHWVRNGHRVFDRLAQLAQPTIAVISGPAYGGGLELVATCDLRVMAPNATLALPETGIGVVPGWSGTQRLTRQLPASVVKEMALLGKHLSAERAYEIGFVNALAEDPGAAAQAMAEEITLKSSQATEVTKFMLQAALGEATDAAVEALGGGLIAGTDDKAEGVASFLEKRKPDFSRE